MSHRSLVGQTNGRTALDGGNMGGERRKDRLVTNIRSVTQQVLVAADGRANPPKYFKLPYQSDGFRLASYWCAA